VPTELIETLAAGGAWGVLALALLWIQRESARRLDEQGARLDTMQQEHYRERVEVIERLVDSTATLTANVEGMKDQIDAVQTGIAAGLREMRDHYLEQKLKGSND